MKRYYIEAYCRVCDCEIATKKRPSEYGDYYLVTDVERTMIPRPDPEEARKAVNKVKRLVKTQCKSFRRHGLTEEIAEAEKELLRLMGVQDGR